MAIIRTVGAWRNRQPRKHPEEWLVVLPSVPGWDGWHIQMQLGRLLDGTPVLKGLLLEPNDGFGGKVADQVLTTQRLRQLPLGLLLAAGAQFLAEEAGDSTVQEGLDLAVFDASKRHTENLIEAGIREGLGDPQDVHQLIVELYRTYTRRQGRQGVRKHIAERLDIHERTVDRHLAQARQQGELERYPGRRGKFGKLDDQGGES